MHFLYFYVNINIPNVIFHFVIIIQNIQLAILFRLSVFCFSSHEHYTLTPLKAIFISSIEIKRS